MSGRPEPIQFTSRSPAETRQQGMRLAKRLKAHDVLALTGEIGSGKTTFVQGLALGLKIPLNAVASPSFVLIREYRGKIPLYHADLFRLEKPPEVFSVGLEEYYEKEGITVIEWANRIPEVLPEEFLEVKFHLVDPKTRRIDLAPHGKTYEERFR